MKLIKPSFKIWDQPTGLEGVYKQIERVGRVCYKSEDKITEDSAKPFVDRMIASNHCYTGDSSVLTEHGWVPWRSYSGEKVAVVNQRGDFVSFEVPSRVIKQEYSGKYYYYPALGLKVTEGHRMYGLFRESKNDFYNNTSYCTFVCGQSYNDNNGREKTLGERMFKVPKHCTRPIHSNPFYELVGFWLGDGCYQSQTVNKLVFHLKKQRKIQYLRKLCEELGYEFEVGKSDYYKVCYHNIGSDFNRLFYKESGKYIPVMYMANDAVAVKSIINGLINSDGSIGTNTKTITYTSTNFSIMMWLLNTASIGGYTVSNFKSADWSRPNPNHNRVYKVYLLDSDYTISNDTRNPDSKVIITEETQDVYCVTVSTGLIIVRGDNQVTSICGNCAMLEHGTVYLSASDNTGYNQLIGEYETDNPLDKYENNPYSIIIPDKVNGEDGLYVTTNLRVLVENNWLGDLKYLCEPTEYHEKRYTVHFICDRGVSHEFVRHRTMSFAMESQRYCNYSKDKYNNEVTFCIPCWLSLDEQTIHKGDFEKSGSGCEDSWVFINSLLKAESDYFYLLHEKWKPEQARTVLPNATKTELVMTGFASDWDHFFRLRTSIIAKTGKPHPSAAELVDPLYKKFVSRGYLKAVL